jgi:hypothetical protein
MAPIPPVTASPDRTMPRAFSSLMACRMRSSVCSGLSRLISALAASIAGPPLRYWAQPSSEASTKRWISSFFSFASFFEIAIVVW